VAYTWWAQRRGLVRNTLAAGACDIVMGVPADSGRILTTRPYYRSTYVFVSRRDRRLDLRSLDDPRLRTLRVGVQLVGDDGQNTPPAHGLASRGVVGNLVGYTLYGNYMEPNPPARIVDGVAHGDIDVAIGSAAAEELGAAAIPGAVMTAARVMQSMLDAAGPEAARIERLWWLMFWVTTIVYVGVMAWAAIAFVRGRRRADDTPVSSRLRIPAEADSDRSMRTVVAAAVGGSVVVLLGLLVASVFANRAVASLGASSAVSINLIGYQWWWEAEYESATSSERFRTATELHIPVGRPVVLKVTSRDVIHSVWLPNLQGKRDPIPGYTTAIWPQADRPGLYRGQCSEFCGLEHARMVLYVTAESNDEFEKWREQQIKPAVEPTTDESRAGRDVCLHATCTQCHTIRGTIAGAALGPDLTHLASRGSIAAGTLPNRRGHLAGGIADPQRIKPGVRMPPNSVQSDDLQRLLTYLETLK
jgi:cytochrome c oxidase subunit 2